MLADVTYLTKTAGPGAGAPGRPGRRFPFSVHRAWIVAAVTFVTIIGGAAFNSLPGLLIDPLHSEFGWSRGEIGLAVSIDMALYGLTAPFAAALMDRFGIRRVVAIALTMVAAGALASVWMTASWQLMIYWGLLVGLGTLVGLWARLAALGGALISLSLWLTVSWQATPYYYGNDLPYLMAWLPLVLAGASVFSADAFLASRRRRSM